MKLIECKVKLGKNRGNISIKCFKTSKMERACDCNGKIVWVSLEYLEALNTSYDALLEPVEAVKTKTDTPAPKRKRKARKASPRKTRAKKAVAKVSE